MTYLLDPNIVVFLARGLKVRANQNTQQRAGASRSGW